MVSKADRTGKRPWQGQPIHFDKLMDSPCTNHTYPIKFLYKDYELLKRFLWQAGKPKEGKGKEDAVKKGGMVGRDEDGFPNVRKMDPRTIYFGFWCLMTNTTKLD